jgi:hypothetical protein
MLCMFSAVHCCRGPTKLTVGRHTCMAPGLLQCLFLLSFGVAGCVFEVWRLVDVKMEGCLQVGTWRHSQRCERMLVVLCLGHGGTDCLEPGRLLPSCLLTCCGAGRCPFTLHALACVECWLAAVNSTAQRDAHTCV